MKIEAITRDGVIGVDAYTRQCAFISLHRVDVAFDDGGFMRIPAGFVFDGASIPPLARSLIPSLSTAGSVSFLCHDYAYAAGSHFIAPNGNHISISRQRADWIALALCEWLGLRCEDSLKIYSALRIGGAGSYRRLPVERTLWQWVHAQGGAL